MTLKQAVFATLLAGGAVVALATGRDGTSGTDGAAAPETPAPAVVAQAGGPEAAPAPADAPHLASDTGAADDGPLAEAIAAAVAEAEADRLRLAADLAEAEAEKSRLAAALTEAEAEAERLAEALEAALAGAPASAETPVPSMAPDLAALQARIADQGVEIERLAAALAERDATIAALEDERKILGGLFDLAPMTAGLSAPVLGAAAPADADADTAADLDTVLDAAKTPPPRARPTTLMAGRPVAEVHFDHGMSRLSPGGADRAREAARLIAALGVTRVRLSAHADTTGRAAANMRLSQNRAEAVKAMLVAEGVRPEIIEIEAHGQEADALPIATAAGIAEPLNRRVGIYVETTLRTAALR